MLSVLLTLELRALTQKQTHSLVLLKIRSLDVGVSSLPIQPVGLGAQCSFDDDIITYFFLSSFSNQSSLIATARCNLITSKPHHHALSPSSLNNIVGCLLSLIIKYLQVEGKLEDHRVQLPKFK